MNRKEALEILGFSPSDNSSEDEIKKAYKKLALEYHPDEHSGASKDEQKQNEEKFKELGAAYTLITGEDTEKVTKLTDENLDEINSSEDLKFYLYTALLKQDIASLEKLFSKFKSSKDGKFGDYINEMRFKGYLPLAIALIKAEDLQGFSLLNLLLENGANPNIEIFREYTSLHLPGILERSEIVGLLLEYGASPDVKDQKGRSLFYYISYSDIDRYKVVELLLDKGVSPNIQDDQGRAPLHYLCGEYYKVGSVEIAKLLLRRGADPDLKDKDGKKPIDLVSSYNDVAKLFGAVNYKKVFRFGCATLLTTAGSIALISGVADAYIGKVWCSTLAVGMAAIALYCAYQTIKMMFFSGSSTEFTEARAESFNSHHQIQWVQLNNYS